MDVFDLLGPLRTELSDDKVIAQLVAKDLKAAQEAHQQALHCPSTPRIPYSLRILCNRIVKVPVLLEYAQVLEVVELIERGSKSLNGLFGEVANEFWRTSTALEDAQINITMKEETIGRQGMLLEQVRLR